MRYHHTQSLLVRGASRAYRHAAMTNDAGQGEQLDPFAPAA